MSDLPELFEESYQKVLSEDKMSRIHLYDLFFKHELKWPSLTAEWLPETTRLEDSNYMETKVILGGYVGVNMSHLYILKIKFPNFDMPETLNTTEFAAGQCAPEVGLKLNIKGQVVRARHMPQCSSIIAVKTAGTEIQIFDCERHPSEPTGSNPSIPELGLLGTKAGSWGLSWSSLSQGLLLSASDDNSVSLWNVVGGSYSLFSGHTDIVEDVAWHKQYDCIFGSVADDGKLMIWDSRLDSTLNPVQSVQAHYAAINSLSFNRYYEYSVVTGSMDQTVAFWDLRNFKRKLNSLSAYNDAVFKVEWSPHNEYILASTDSGCRLCVWDISKVSQEQYEEDAGPPELLFTHGGHTKQISDFSWNVNERLVLCSLSEKDLQVWQMKENVYD